MSQFEDMILEPLAHERKYKGDKIFKNFHMLPQV